MAMTKNDMAPPQNEMRPLKTTITVAVSGTTTPMIPRIAANTIARTSAAMKEKKDMPMRFVINKMVFTHNVAPP